MALMRRSFCYLHFKVSLMYVVLALNDKTICRDQCIYGLSLLYSTTRDTNINANRRCQNVKHTLPIPIRMAYTKFYEYCYF